MRNVLMELTNAFKLKRICFTLSPTILSSLFLTALYCDASLIKYSARSEDKIAGYASDLGLAFTAVLEEDMIKINLQFNEKEIIVKKGYGKREKVFYMEGYATESGGMVTLKKEDFDVLETLMMEIDSDNNYLDKMFLNTLNLLHSWPPTLPLLVLMDESIVFFIPAYLIPLVFNRSVFDSSIVDICYDCGKLHQGRYLKLHLFSKHSWEEITGTVGGEECFGRCGISCVGKSSKYTQDCFNHDACVSNVGYIALACDIMFISCIEDFLIGPNCNTETSTKTKNE